MADHPALAEAVVPLREGRTQAWPCIAPTALSAMSSQE